MREQSSEFLFESLLCLMLAAKLAVSSCHNFQDICLKVVALPNFCFSELIII